MIKELLLELILVETIVIVFFLAVVLLVARIKNDIELDNKFSKYTIKKDNSLKLSLIDKLLLNLSNVVKKISNRLSKINYLVNKSKKYEKYIKFEQLKKINTIDFISLKILLSTFLVVLYIILNLLSFDGVNIFGIFLSILLGFLLPSFYLKFDYNKRKKQIEEDLLNAIVIMNNAFETGKSISQAIISVKDELDGPISDEFKKIYQDLSYGLTLEVVFDRFYNRVKIEDVKYITSSLIILNKTGGNIVKVFSSIEKEIFNKKRLNDEIKTMTSSSMFIFKILLFLPFVLYSIIFILNKSYFMPLFTTAIGLLILSFIIILYIIYIIVVRKIMKVEI